MSRAIKRVRRRLSDMGVRVLHDTSTDTFYLSEMYHRQHIGTYTRAEFLVRWCGVEEISPR